MAYAVSSWFVDQTLASVAPIRQLILPDTAGSVTYTDRVTRWPDYRRRYDQVSPGTITAVLANEDGHFNYLRSTKATMTGTAALQIGYTHPTSGPEMVTLAQGTISAINFGDGAVTVTVMDKWKKLTETVVGDTSSPVLFTGSNYLVSDVAWWLVTSYGVGYSAVNSTSNPDIHWADFQAWASVFSENNTRIQARFDGVKTSEALRRIARYTDSAIYIAENKVRFKNFAAYDVPAMSLNDDNMTSVNVRWDDEETINNQYVYGLYDSTSNAWGLNVLAVASVSVSSWGVRMAVEKDDKIWYTDSVSCLFLAQRRVAAYGDPHETFQVGGTLAPIVRQIGDTVSITDELFGVSSGETWRILGFGYDLNTGKSTIEASGYELLIPFTLDDSANGLLDQNYNFLL